LIKNKDRFTETEADADLCSGEVGAAQRDRRPMTPISEDSPQTTEDVNGHRNEDRRQEHQASLAVDGSNAEFSV
jgi:hypothetical protein